MSLSWQSVFQAAHACLMEQDIENKLSLSTEAQQAWLAGRLRIDGSEAPRRIDIPGRPHRPHLVPPRALPNRSLHSESGRAALIHALCHIEFNAINLGWDAVYRFRHLSRDYYTDWIRVAVEEASHFTLLRDHLQQMGYDYGDFDAHNGLWEMAVKTDFDPLVPRVLEARGLDVMPGMMAKLAGADDERAVTILKIIHHDEVGHVGIGSRWFEYLCHERGWSPAPTFEWLVSQHMKGKLKGPFDRAARRRAGFSEAELDYLEGAG